MAKQRVLITGSSGRIGQHLCRHLSDYYDLRGFDRVPAELPGQQITGETGDEEALQTACEGVDVLVHLAANPSYEASWEETLESNIQGTQNVFVAAQRAGVKKIVYASTCQVTFGYGSNSLQTPDMYPRSLSYYAASKVLGEQLGHVFAYRHGIDVICIRVGLFSERGRIPAHRAAGRLLGLNDAIQIFQRAIDVMGVRFAVVYGVSRSSRQALDLEEARRVLSYIPTECEDDLITE